jgi:hypothetical protein
MLMITMLLLTSALWLRAQEGMPGADVSRAPAGKSPTTIEGCLYSSGGHYTVTDKHGNVHRLTGSTAKLSRFVGHEVAITGKPTVITLATTMTQTASSAEELPALRVEHAKLLSNTCKSASH